MNEFVVVVEGWLLGTAVISPEQVEATGSIPLPVGKERQIPISPVLTSGEIEGNRHPLRLEITKICFPLSNAGKNITDMAAVSSVSRQILESSEVDDPVGSSHLQSENNCTAPCEVTDLKNRVITVAQIEGRKKSLYGPKIGHEISGK
jgi:hypothetical protein